MKKLFFERSKRFNDFNRTKVTKSCLLLIILFTFFITGSYAAGVFSFPGIDKIEEEKTEPKLLEGREVGSGAVPRFYTEPVFTGYYTVGGYANITFKTYLNTVSVSIVGENGALVYETSVNTSVIPVLNIDISNYPVGSYIISVVGEDGTKYIGDIVID